MIVCFLQLSESFIVCQHVAVICQATILHRLLVLLEISLLYISSTFISTPVTCKLRLTCETWSICGSSRARPCSCRMASLRFGSANLGPQKPLPGLLITWKTRNFMYQSSGLVGPAKLARAVVFWMMNKISLRRYQGGTVTSTAPTQDWLQKRSLPFTWLWTKILR